MFVLLFTNERALFCPSHISFYCSQHHLCTAQHVLKKHSIQGKNCLQGPWTELNESRKLFFLCPLFWQQKWWKFIAVLCWKDFGILLTIFHCRSESEGFWNTEPSSLWVPISRNDSDPTHCSLCYCILEIKAKWITVSYEYTNEPADR